jgi:hypothetical protein
MECLNFYTIVKTSICNLNNLILPSPFSDKKSFIGTARYSSIAAHKGYELGRKDDLESLFYVIIYFIKGYFFTIKDFLVNSHGRTYQMFKIKIEQ